MSNVTPSPAVVVPEVKDAPANVVEDVDKHTPDPETPPVVDRVPAPADPGPEGLDELRELVGGLATAVATLTDTVAGIVSKSDADDSPTRVPWTHRGGTVHHGSES